MVNHAFAGTRLTVSLQTHDVWWNTSTFATCMVSQCGIKTGSVKRQPGSRKCQDWQTSRLHRRRQQRRCIPLFVAYLLTFILTRPLLPLRKMALQVAAGDLTARSRVWSRDEIGQLATAVNTMTDHLLASQGELARSNRRLAAINRPTTSLMLPSSSTKWR